MNFKTIEEYKAYEEKKIERKTEAEFKVASFIANNKDIEIYYGLECHRCIFFIACTDMAKDMAKDKDMFYSPWSTMLKDRESSVCKFVDSHRDHIFSIRFGSLLNKHANSSRNLSFVCRHPESDMDKLRSKVYLVMDAKRTIKEYYQIEATLKSMEVVHE